uniref:Uncharacterized protein n=1 Tax=Lygus hesperus TaxID=30085 RepID=A0A0A9XD34_LYGHE
MCCKRDKPKYQIVEVLIPLQDFVGRGRRFFSRPPIVRHWRKLLEAVKRLLGNLTNLKRLELTDLMLDNSEAMTLLDDVCCERCESLRYLSLSNFTKGQYQLLHLGVFVNLQILVVGPQNLGEQVMELISHTKLKHLHIVQTRLTPASARSLSPKCWQAAAKQNPNMRVHLALETKTDRQLLWQEKAPVNSILVDSPACKLEPDNVMRIIQWYSENLRYFGYLGIPKYHQPKSFNERMDPFLVMLVKECPKIETFVIREKVSTSTVLLVAEQCKSLKRYYVRRNAVILKCDWPCNPNWEDSYFSWLKKSSRSYEETENEVSRILGFRWKMLSDKEFVALNPPLYT